MSLKTLQGKLLASLLLGLAVVIVMGLATDAREVGRDLGGFRWELLPAILGLTLAELSAALAEVGILSPPPRPRRRSEPPR